MDFKIKQACAYYYAKHGVSCEKKLAVKLSPESKEMTAEANFYNLLKNDTKSLTCDKILIICKETGVTADQLTGLENL